MSLGQGQGGSCVSDTPAGKEHVPHVVLFAWEILSHFVEEFLMNPKFSRMMQFLIGSWDL